MFELYNLMDLMKSRATMFLRLVFKKEIPRLPLNTFRSLQVLIF
jgi:hypothetical protein